MSMNRRVFVARSVLTGLAAACADVFKTAAAAPLDTQHYANLCQRWGDIITGRQFIKPDEPQYAHALAALNRKVTETRDDLVRTPKRQQVFASINLDDGHSNAITATARAVLTLAIGWATPGSGYYQQSELLDDTIAALRDFLRLRYHAGQEEYGNWWDWESGAARAVGDMMCLLQQALPDDVMAEAIAAIHYFIPDPWFLRATRAPGSSQQGQQEPVVSTGANRVDLCRAVICQALAGGDAPRVRHALAGLAEVWALVTQGDGFYRDGSFIQHKHVPYTGSYGGVLLDGWAKLFTLVGDSAFTVSDAQRQTVYDRIEQAFVPVMVDGQVLDSVRGRSVSRMKENAAAHGKGIMLAMLQVAQGSPAEVATRWRAICRGWMARNHYDDFRHGNTIPHIALLADTFAAAEEAAPLTEPTMFSSMDRLVHRSTGWTVAIAMCGRRIAWYECGNGENNLGARTSLGMRYLYLPNDMGQYEDGFWPTLDYAAPTGTTVDSHPLVPKVTGEWGEQTPQNEWTGGLTQGRLSLAGMQLIGPDDDGLQARRTWLGTPWGMIEAVSDVHTDADYALSVVEHRNLGAENHVTLVVDGTPVSATTEFDTPQWAHLEGVGGYVFLTPVSLSASVVQRQGSWAEINTRTQTEAARALIQRYWASMHIHHSAQNNAAAWLLLPTLSRDDTEQLATALHNQRAEERNVSLLHNDAAAQVIAVGEDTTGWSIWQPGTYAQWQFAQPMVVLATRQGDALHISAADPTQQAAHITLTLPGRWALSATEGVQADSDAQGQTVLQFATAGREGRSLHCVLTASA